MSREDDRYTENGWNGYGSSYPDQENDNTYGNDPESYGDENTYGGYDNAAQGGQYSAAPGENTYNGNSSAGGPYSEDGYTQGNSSYDESWQEGSDNSYTESGYDYGNGGYDQNGAYNGQYQEDYQDGDGYQSRDSYQDGYQYSDDSWQGNGRYQRDAYGNDGYDDGYDDYGRDNGGYDDGYGSDENGYDEDSGYGDAQYGPYGGGEPEKNRNKNKNRKGSGASSVKGGKGGGKKKKNTKRIVLLVIEIAALLVVIGVLYMVTRVERVGKVDLSETAIQENISDEVKQDEETGAMKGYRQIVFFGVDSTEGQLDQKTRSDSIIIASINQDTDEVKLISVYRDTLLNLSNGEYNKCNAAYAQGGPEQAINMLNMNLDLNISDFVTIGFGGLTDVINALGGVEIDVDEDEISHLNNYQSTMAKELGISYTEVTSPGLQTLDGLQATAYCRIRYTYGWDYKRAARQREVLYQIIGKAQQASVSQLAQIATDAFSEIYTSYDLNNLVSDVSSIASYTVIQEEDTDQMQNGFPQEQYRIQANLSNALGDCVVPRTLVQNVEWLHQFLFDDTDYQVSDQVQTISDHIDEMTVDAVPEEMTDADHT